MSYVDYVKKLASKISTDLLDLSVPRERGRMPNSANSNFVIHREQGDWAEDIFTKALVEVLPNFVVLRYGKSDRIMAGEPGFKEFYANYQDELDTIGKRPDTLLFKQNATAYTSGENVSNLKLEEIADLIPKASIAFEVRSSAFLNSKYGLNKKPVSEVKKKKPNSNSKRDTLSFTPKVEDLKVILKWIETYGVLHYYVQVFFDEVHAIPFTCILEILAEPSNKDKIFTLDKHERSQMKWTVHIPLKQGVQLGIVDKLPVHSSQMKVLPNGRILYYVSFSEGHLQLDQKAISELVLTSSSV